MGRRAEFQILEVIARESVEGGGLAGQQSAGGLGLGGLRRREVDAVQGQLGLEFMHLRGFLDLDVAGSIGGAAAAVIGRALDGVSAGLQAGRIKLHVRAAASDLPAGGRVAISQRIVVRVAAIAGDSGVFTRERSEEHTSELQSHSDLVCRLLLEKKKKSISRDTAV